MPNVNNKKSLKQQPLDIGIFINNPKKSRIKKHKELTTKAIPCAGPRAHKVPAWLEKKMKKEPQEQWKVKPGLAGSKQEVEHKFAKKKQRDSKSFMVMPRL